MHSLRHDHGNDYGRVSGYVHGNDCDHGSGYDYVHQQNSNRHVHDDHDPLHGGHGFHECGLHLHDYLTYFY